MVPAASLYGFPVGGLAQAHVNTLRGAIMTALWGTKRKLRCKEVVLTLLAPGHLIDPVQYIGFQCLRMVRRILMAQPHLQETFAKTWQMHKDGAPAAPGPVKELCKVLVHMGWSWDNPWHFGRPSRRQLGLFEGSEGWWLHEVRDGLRIAEWKIAAGRRADMIGMQSDHGVDKLATLAL